VLFLIFSAGLILTIAEAGPRAGAEPPLQGKKEDFKLATMTSIDGVELKGRYYPSSKANAPAVIFLHGLNDSGGKEWANLAKKLQAKGYAVLMFDFRGHGDSTTVNPGKPYDPKNPKQPAEPGFWDQKMNMQYVKGYSAKNRPTEIKYEQFQAAYVSALANDIATAKAFLDAQPDCNSSNLILIGAGDGATLGALWLSSEWHRFRYLPPALGRPQGALDRQNPEGTAVSAAVWLSISPTMGTNKAAYSVQKMLERPGRIGKTPMIFMYGEGDAKAGDLAKKCETYLSIKKTKTDPGYTPAAVKIVGAEKMAGKNLLLESLPTTNKILEFLDEVVDWKKGTTTKKVNDDDFMWEYQDTTGRMQQVIARKKGVGRAEFSGYAQFLK